MTLQINCLEDCYEVVGTLNKSNVKKFDSYFKNVVSNSEQITINIEALSSIDRAGVNALVKLYLKSLENQSQFYIIGFGSRDMHEHLRSVESAA